MGGVSYCLVGVRERASHVSFYSNFQWISRGWETKGPPTAALALFPVSTPANNRRQKSCG